MSQKPSPFLAPPFKQSAVVVEDLDEAVRRWADLLGVGPWTGYRLESSLLKEMRYHGEEAEFSLRHTLAWQGDLQFELVEPLDGPSIFADHLADHGEGLHHVGKYVADHEQAVAEALRAGFVPLQSARGFGVEGDGAFAYFRAPGISMIVELIEAPRVRIEPEFVYYPPTAG